MNVFVYGMGGALLRAAEGDSLTTVLGNALEIAQQSLPPEKYPPELKSIGDDQVLVVSVTIAPMTSYWIDQK